MKVFLIRTFSKRPEHQAPNEQPYVKDKRSKIDPIYLHNYQAIRLNATQHRPLELLDCSLEARTRVAKAPCNRT